MADISDHPDLSLQVIATGMHLAPEFGNTWEAICADGFEIDERVEMLLASDSAVGVAKSTGLGTIGMADAYARLEPDLVVLLGDRFEILAATQAAMLMRLPIAHIAGGEATEGAFDDSIRHAITKMSSIHFTAADPYRDRVVQMGENPEMVFQVGAIGLDNFERLPLLSSEELSQALDFDVTGNAVVLCTYHPVTLSDDSPEELLAPIFEAFESLAGTRVVFTKGNADTGGREMNRLIDEFVARHPDRMASFASLGQERYLSMLRAAAVVVGNSSSGIVEAPAAGIPTVNIGDRQKGRLRAPSILDVDNDSKAILQAIERALSADYRRVAAQKASPFGEPGASSLIVRTLAEIDLESMRSKRFYPVKEVFRHAGD